MKTDITGTKKRIEKVNTRISELSMSIENQQAIFKTAKQEGDISSIASQNQKLNVLLSEKSALQESVDLLNSQLAALELEALKTEEAGRIAEQEKNAEIFLKSINKKLLDSFTLLSEVITAGSNPPNYFDLRIGNITRTNRLRKRMSALSQITTVLNKMLVINQPLQGRSEFEIEKLKSMTKEEVKNILDLYMEVS